MSHAVSPTSENIEHSEPVAFGFRLLTYLADAITATLLLLAFNAILAVAGTGLLFFELFLYTAFPFLALFLYKTISETFWSGTLCRRLLHHRVEFQGVDNAPLPRLGRAALRNSWAFVAFPLSYLFEPSIFMNLLMLVIAISMAWDRNYRSLMDKLARARVVKADEQLVDAPTEAPKTVATPEEGTPDEEPQEENIETKSLSAAELIARHRAELGKEGEPARPRTRRRRAADD
ncbi:RDD family protein [Staphylococcus chromogenes]|nr:RDD family protein [Staphylococcus chromogenes]